MPQPTGKQPTGKQPTGKQPTGKQPTGKQPTDQVPQVTSTRWALAGLSLSMLMASLDTSIANVALPVLARSFDATFRSAQWIVLAYLLATTTLILGAGHLGDLVGRRRLLLAGITLFTTASVLCGAAVTLPMLIAARAVQGAGAAVMMALTVAFVGETAPKSRTGSAMGLLGTMSAIGTAFGPTLGGLLIAGLGWRSIFLVNIPLGVLNLVLAQRHLPADRRAPVERGTRPALPGRELFRGTGLGAGLLMSALVASVMMGTLVVGPFYLARALALEPAAVGFVMSLGPLVAALAGLPAGHLVDRIGTKRVTLAGLAGIAAGTTALSMTSPSLGIASYAAPIVFVTGGYALFQAANNTAVMTGIPAQRRGVLSGALSLSRNLGLITGTAALGAVFSWAAGAKDVTHALPEAVAAATRATFATATAVVALALALAGATARRRTTPAVYTEPGLSGV